jgi:hypothetical protein
MPDALFARLSYDASPSGFELGLRGEESASKRAHSKGFATSKARKESRSVWSAPACWRFRAIFDPDLARLKPRRLRNR